MLRLYSYNAKRNLGLSLQVIPSKGMLLVNIDYFLEWARKLGSTHIIWHRWREISFPYQINTEFPEKERTVKYRDEILNGSLNTWFTMEIKIGRQYHGCPKKICLLISATILNQHGSHYCTLTKLINAQINNHYWSGPGWLICINQHR